jgi:hypothetical protein
MKISSLDLKLPNFTLYNKIEANHQLTDKKTLFHNMKLYYESIDKDPFDYLPYTIVIEKGFYDDKFKEFVERFSVFEESSIINHNLDTPLLSPKKSGMNSHSSLILSSSKKSVKNIE